MCINALKESMLLGAMEHVGQPKLATSAALLPQDHLANGICQSHGLLESNLHHLRQLLLFDQSAELNWSCGVLRQSPRATLLTSSGIPRWRVQSPLWPLHKNSPNSP